MVSVRVYLPGASTMGVFDRKDETAARNCDSVDTLTIVPVGAANDGAGRAGAAPAAVGTTVAIKAAQRSREHPEAANRLTMRRGSSPSMAWPFNRRRNSECAHLSVAHELP